MLKYGIYTLKLCEMYHILLAWCAPLKATLSI